MCAEFNPSAYMRIQHFRFLFFSIFLAATGAARAQVSNSVAGPDPREIPLPPIKTAMGTLPGVNDLPVRDGMPDVLTMNNGTRVTSIKQWKKRREIERQEQERRRGPSEKPRSFHLDMYL